jgi:arylsulfatase A-like enzyme
MFLSRIVRGCLTQRFFLSLLLLFASIGVACSSSEPTVVPAPDPPKHPNILFILTDDLDTDSIKVMPQLKSLLIEQGTLFSNFFITTPLCCPSRTSILRGQYAHNTQIFGNQIPHGGFEKVYSLGLEESTIATWLHAVGYNTALMGKYLNAYPMKNSETYVPPGWDEWYSPVEGQPYSGFNYTLNENGKLVSYGNNPKDYGTDVYHRKATRFITSAIKSGKPFFVYLSTYTPHEPATPAPRHQDLFADAEAPHSPSFNEGDVSDKPRRIRNLHPLNNSQIINIDELYRRRLQSLQAIDEMLANLVETLEGLGQLENTYIVFSSDNGYHLGHHRLRFGKQTPYEEDIRVPLVVRGPNVPVGQVIEHLTANIDLAPTFAEWAGVTAADFVDGRSLVPLLSGNSPLENIWRQAILLETNTTRRDTPVPAFQAIRTKDYKYVEYVTGERELYDLSKDPHELQNINEIADPALIQQLAARLVELRSCAARSCRDTEDAPFSP